MKWRIACVVILLFSFAPVFAQVRLDRSMFKVRARDRQMPELVFGVRPSTLNGSGESELREGLLSLQSSGCDSPGDSLKVEGDAVREDTVLNSKSPGLAMILSMIVPGSGQVYVHRYITIPIIWGFGYYFAWAWNQQNNRYHQYRDLYSASVLADSTGQGNAQYQSIRDFYRDDRDKFAFYLAITYILNIVDAYVGASLYSFDVSDNLGGSAAIRFRIPLR